MDSYGSSYVDFLTNGFVASAKFLVDDAAVAVAADDDAAVSSITDVSMVQQLGRLLALMDSNSLFVKKEDNLSP